MRIVFPPTSPRPWLSPLCAAMLATGCVVACIAGCDAGEPAPPTVAGGRAELGKALLAQYQCGACHTIPGVAAARGEAGPALAQFGRRSYIAGGIPNAPEALVRWIVDPRALKENTAMPSMGVSAADARHMAAYLYTAR